MLSYQKRKNDKVAKQKGPADHLQKLKPNNTSVKLNLAINSASSINDLGDCAPRSFGLKIQRYIYSDQLSMTPQKRLFRVKFDTNKAKPVARTRRINCKNSISYCASILNITVITRSNSQRSDSNWNHEYSLVTTNESVWLRQRKCRHSFMYE